jgi:Uma2 family endonuclease
MATKELMTVEEFSRMSTAEGEDYELVDGELIPLSSAIPIHGAIRDALVFHVRGYLAKGHLGGTASETDCRINEDTVRRPDLSIFLGEHWTQLDLYQIPTPLAPDIAVEILSPSEHVVDLNRKVRDYLSAGSQEVWLIDHANGEVHVRTRTGIRLLQDGDLLDSPLLPGFSVRIPDLLAAR